MRYIISKTANVAKYVLVVDLAIRRLVRTIIVKALPTIPTEIISGTKTVCTQNCVADKAASPLGSMIDSFVLDCVEFSSSRIPVGNSLMLRNFSNELTIFFRSDRELAPE
jgi:hypothetical protein